MSRASLTCPSRPGWPAKWSDAARQRRGSLKAVAGRRRRRGIPAVPVLPAPAGTSACRFWLCAAAYDEETRVCLQGAGWRVRSAQRSAFANHRSDEHAVPGSREAGEMTGSAPHRVLSARGSRRRQRQRRRGDRARSAQRRRCRPAGHFEDDVDLCARSGLEQVPLAVWFPRPMPRRSEGFMKRIRAQVAIERRVSRAR